MNDDGALFEAWLGGDAESGRKIIERHYDRLFLFFHARVDADAAADLTQATFETLCTKRAEFRGDSSVRTFLFGIARLKLASYIRTPGMLRASAAAFDEEFVPTVSARSLTSLLLARSQESLLVQALRSLSFDDQILLELKDYEEMTGREMAEVFDVPQGTIATRLRKARQRLSDAVARLEKDPARRADTLTNLEQCMRTIQAKMRAEWRATARGA